MTPFFIKTFKKEHKCPACPAKKQGQRSFCAYHLRLAREKWANWSVERRSAGLCSYCHRKSFRGWLRCRIHTAVNRAKCRAWMRANPDYSRNQWERNKAQYTANGLCVTCKEHRPVVPGGTRCAVCRQRSLELRAGTRAPWEGTSKGGIYA